MKGSLGARLDRLEAALPDPNNARPQRVIRIVASDEEEAAARELAKAEGWDPVSNDICIIRLIAHTASQKAEGSFRQPPRVMSKSW